MAIRLIDIINDILGEEYKTVGGTSRQKRLLYAINDIIKTEV